MNEKKYLLPALIIGMLLGVLATRVYIGFRNEFFPRKEVRTSSGVIKFPEGIFILKSPLEIDTDNVVFEGQGDKTIFDCQIYHVSPCFDVEGKNNTFKNMYILGGGTSTGFKVH